MNFREDSSYRQVWLSSEHGHEVYSVQQDNEVEPGAIAIFCSIDFTLLSGSNIGQPYTVGNSWNYTWNHQVFVKSGPIFFSPTEEIFTVQETVRDENVSIEVPAGTFDDCFKIERSMDKGEGFIHTRTDWYSPSVGAAVKIIEEGAANGIETWELQSYYA
jgi:hypothetical protein